MDYSGVKNIAFCRFLGKKVSPVVQSTSPVHRSSPPIVYSRYLNSQWNRLVLDSRFRRPSQNLSEKVTLYILVSTTLLQCSILLSIQYIARPSWQGWHQSQAVVSDEGLIHKHIISSPNLAIQYGGREGPYTFRFGTFLNLMISHFQTCVFPNLTISKLKNFCSCTFPNLI